MIMNNSENIYYGHGTGTDEAEKLTSILTYGLYCRYGDLGYTACVLGTGNNIGEETTQMLKKWPYMSSSKIIIISLPKKFNILDSFSMGTHQKGNAAFYYSPDENQRQVNGLNDGYYVMPEFILGYYDSVRDEFYRNQIYYELLPDAALNELLDMVKRNYLRILEESCGIEKYREFINTISDWKFPLSDKELMDYLGKNDTDDGTINSDSQVTLSNERKMDVSTLIKCINPTLLQRNMILPNGMQVSALEYIEKIVFPHLPKDGIVILNNGSKISVKQFIENYVFGECQQKYYGDFSRYIIGNTKANDGMVSININGVDKEINANDIVDYINPELLDKGVMLPSRTIITVRQFIQNFYVPHIPKSGRVILINGMSLSVIQYIEGILLGEALFKYNGDIGQILYNTTRRNVGVINYFE